VTAGQHRNVHGRGGGGIENHVGQRTAGGARHDEIARREREPLDIRAQPGDTRLESRPIAGEPWEYRFFADLRGPSAEGQRAATEALRAVATEVRVLGQYREEA